jgi:hypothetical protein
MISDLFLYSYLARVPYLDRAPIPGSFNLSPSGSRVCGDGAGEKGSGLTSQAILPALLRF